MNGGLTRCSNAKPTTHVDVLGCCMLERPSNPMTMTAAATDTGWYVGHLPRLMSVSVDLTGPHCTVVSTVGDSIMR